MSLPGVVVICDVTLCVVGGAVVPVMVPVVEDTVVAVVGEVAVVVVPVNLRNVKKSF